MKRNQWEDHYTRQARKERWLARSVYKLQEIDQKFRIFARGNHVLDLGCYPGSWSQYALLKIKPGGLVTGIDLKVPDHLSDPRFRFLKADILLLDPESLEDAGCPLKVVMSDLAPRTTGIKEVDAARSMDLVRKASEIASSVLCPGGRFICKVFEGEDFRGFRDEVALRYKEVRIFRTGATRKKSREIYLIAKGFHP
ncbi:MAG: 50S rRNA methyltransferase [Deltaproteobacteria bacterium]|nr:MAG: 50S rRNA methyltransferase [Deltaproteobacteria bacterium]